MAIEVTTTGKPVTLKIKISHSAIYSLLSMIIFHISAMQELIAEKTNKAEDTLNLVLKEAAQREAFKAIFRAGMSKYERYYFAVRNEEHEPIIIAALTKKEKEDLRYLKPQIRAQIKKNDEPAPVDGENQNAK